MALTYALDTTVGGTLSIGGVGAMAWSQGPQVDIVLYLDVVTASGELVRCSLEHERELFDAVRAGLGQCGIIVRAGVRLRPCGSTIETRTFLYPDPDALLRDARNLASDPVPNRLLAVRVAQDPMRAGKLMAILFVGHDLSGDDALPAPTLPALHHSYEPPLQSNATWTSDGCPGHPFFRVFGGDGGALTWGQRKHPWVDFLYPFSAAPTALSALAGNANQLLRRGTSEIIFVRRGANPAPLLVTPEDDDLFMGLGMYPAFADEEAETVARTMQSYARTMAACGGKRYPCGYFGPTETADWAAHYGPAWSRFCTAKKRYDFNLRFESRLLRWP
jgi:FAD/FMN-containing dehydrogenase